MKNINLVLAFGLICTSAPVLADPPAAILVGLRVWVGSTTIDGYTAYSNFTPQEMKKENPTVDEQLAFSMGLGEYMQLFSNPQEVKFPESMLVSTTRPVQLIPRRFITKWERKAMPLDGRRYHGPNNAVPILALELLNRPPLFSCVEKDSWGGVHWLSYSPKWNSEKMKALCEEPQSPQAAEIRRYLRDAVPDVFELKFDVD